MSKPNQRPPHLNAIEASNHTPRDNTLLSVVKQGGMSGSIGVYESNRPLSSSSSKKEADPPKVKKAELRFPSRNAWLEGYYSYSYMTIIISPSPHLHHRYSYSYTPIRYSHEVSL